MSLYSQCLSRVDLLINCKESVEGVQKALAAQDYERAAEFVGGFREVESSGVLVISPQDKQVRSYRSPSQSGYTSFTIDLIVSYL